jgi:predicted component of type VI protein secretion system
MRIRTAIALVTLCVTFAACGSSSNSKAATQVKTFCQMATDLETASSGPHGEDPAAITDPAKMKEMYATITAMAKKMRDGAPAEIKPDVATMVDSLLAMNTIFEKNDYDLLAMSKDEKVRADLAKVTADESVGTASTRFNKYMAANCAK